MHIYLYTYTSQHATENQGEAIGYGMQYEVFPDLGVSLAKEIYKTRPDDPHATRMLLYFTTPIISNHKITKQEQLFLKENVCCIHLVLSYISFVSFYNIYNYIRSDIYIQHIKFTTICKIIPTNAI